MERTPRDVTTLPSGEAEAGKTPNLEPTPNRDQILDSDARGIIAFSVALAAMVTATNANPESTIGKTLGLGASIGLPTYMAILGIDRKNVRDKIKGAARQAVMWLWGFRDGLRIILMLSLGVLIGALVGHLANEDTAECAAVGFLVFGVIEILRPALKILTVVTLALLAVAIILALIFGAGTWLLSIPSWAAVIIVLLVLVVLK